MSQDRRLICEVHKMDLNFLELIILRFLLILSFVLMFCGNSFVQHIDTTDRCNNK